MHAQDDRIDFGLLDEAAQSTVIRAAHKSPEVRQHIAESIDTTPPDAAVLKSNRVLIEQHFNLEAFGEKLMRAYEAVLAGEATSPREALSPAKLLSQFLNPERFRLLRT